jgi:hypothetical protein
LEDICVHYSAKRGGPKKNLRGFEGRPTVTFFKASFLWKHLKQRGGVPQQVVCVLMAQQKIISEFHESWWAGH